MKHLVVGLGEVGRALQEILECDGHDPHKGIMADGHYDMLHIAFPYTSTFKDQVREYQSKFTPKHTVIHSTVPIGTSDELGAAHSAIRGKHPNLRQSILIFEKPVGGKDAQIIVEELRRSVIDATVAPSARDSEAQKLIDLMQYGSTILLMHEIHDFCEKNNLNFDFVYLEGNHLYNKGYQMLHLGHFTRPMLEFMPGKIGGHCVVQNMDKLDTPTAKRIIEENGKL